MIIYFLNHYITFIKIQNFQAGRFSDFSLGTDPSFVFLEKNCLDGDDLRVLSDRSSVERSASAGDRRFLKKKLFIGGF